MPAKHSARTFGAARVVLSFAVAVLVLLVVWVAVRAVGPAEAKRQPTVVLPSAPLIIPSAPSPFLTPAPSPSPSPSLSASPSPSPSKSRKRTASRSPSPAPSSSSPSSSRAKASAVLRVSGGRDDGYMAGVRVENTGSVPLEWRVTVSHDDEVRLRGTWNATGTENGDSLVFRGGPLQPGASVTFGYQATKEGRGSVRPTGCSVVGGTCGMS